MKSVSYGIVQGRLIQCPPGELQWFPQEDWETEFFLASALGYNFIELIAERSHSEANPIWNKEGIEKIKSLCKRNDLELHAFCNDYIIDRSLLDDKSAMVQTHRLIEQGAHLGIQKLILPLFEQSEITENNFKEYREPLKEIAEASQKYNMVVCLETIMDGRALLKLLEFLDHPNLKVVFDTGNRIAFEHDIYADIRLLSGCIQHVHIKDKNKANDNVLLGTGEVNFLEVFKSLSAIGYSGPYTFETTRGRDPVRTARYNMRLVDFFINEAFENEN